MKLASFDMKVVPVTLPTPSQAAATLNILTANGPLPEVVSPPTPAVPMAAPITPQPLTTVLTSKDVSSLVHKQNENRIRCLVLLRIKVLMQMGMWMIVCGTDYFGSETG